MKKFLAFVLLTASCATTKPTESSLELQAMRQLIEEQRVEIEKLKAAGPHDGTSGAVSNSEIARIESQRTARLAPPAVTMLPLAPRVQYGWLYRDPEGCDRKSPWSLEIWNSHDNVHVVVLIDGKPLTILGPSGPLNARTADGKIVTPIPPQARPFTCLDEKGWHTISMVFYAKKRFGAVDVLKELKRYEKRVDFGSRSSPETFEIGTFYSY